MQIYDRIKNPGLDSGWNMLGEKTGWVISKSIWNQILQYTCSATMGIRNEKEINVGHYVFNYVERQIIDHIKEIIVYRNLLYQNQEKEDL